MPRAEEARYTSATQISAATSRMPVYLFRYRPGVLGATLVAALGPIFEVLDQRHPTYEVARLRVIAAACIAILYTLRQRKHKTHMQREHANSSQLLGRGRRRPADVHLLWLPSAPPTPPPKHASRLPRRQSHMRYLGLGPRHPPGLRQDPCHHLWVGRRHLAGEAAVQHARRETENQSECRVGYDTTQATLQDTQLQKNEQLTFGRRRRWAACPARAPPLPWPPPPGSAPSTTRSPPRPQNPGG